MHIRVAINEITFKKYKSLMRSDFCQKLPKLSQSQIDRNLLEFFFICNAFTELNINLKTTFIPSPTYDRSMRMIKTGAAHTSSQTVWDSDIDESSYYQSAEVIRSGEFEKGIYVHPEHPLAHMIPTQIDFSQYKGLTSRYWYPDLATLKSITQNIELTTFIQPRFKMLKARRADFTFLAFSSTPDLSIEQDGITLIPIQGVKVVIPESRRFIFSKHDDDSKTLVTLLDKGLRRMREKGLIMKMYKEGGFINAKTEKWSVINPIK